MDVRHRTHKQGSNLAMKQELQKLRDEAREEQERGLSGRTVKGMSEA
jgi:hypothetical protein